MALMYVRDKTLARLSDLSRRINVPMAGILDVALDRLDRVGARELRVARIDRRVDNGPRPKARIA